MSEAGKDRKADASRPRGRGRVYASITETIGETPLVRIDRIARERGVRANCWPSSSSSTRSPASRTASASR